MPKRTLPHPRSWLANDDDRNDFGREGNLTWTQTRDPHDRALVRAAISQHEFARAVRSLAAEQDISTETLATNIGVSIDQLRRMLRGEAHMSIADMHLLAAQLHATANTGMGNTRRAPRP